MAFKTRTNWNSLTDILLASLENSRAKASEIVTAERVNIAKQYRERALLYWKPKSKKVGVKKEKVIKEAVYGIRKKMKKMSRPQVIKAP